MPKAKIVTDNKYKQFKQDWDVPEKVLRSQFDWMANTGEHSFLKYKGHWYCLADFMTIPQDLGNGKAWYKWDGYSADGYFSGTLIKLSDDGEEYIIGTYVESSLPH